MQTISEFLAVVREMTKIADIEFEDDVYFELVFDDSTSVVFYKIDETSIEICTVVTDDPGGLAPEYCERLLMANYLGHGTGGARLALDPRDSSLILCERLNFVGMNADWLQARIERFVAYAKMWLAGEMDEFLGKGNPTSAPVFDAQLHIRG